jgi:hypothetical protein
MLLNLLTGNLGKPGQDFQVGFQAALYFTGCWKIVPPWGRVNILLASPELRRQEISSILLKLVLKHFPRTA